MAMVCALPTETIAVRAMFDQKHPPLPGKEGDSNRYHLGELCGYNVVLACLPGTQGKGAAAIVTTNMARSFPCIRWRFLVGIGGGVPSEKHDIRLGDVVVSMPSGTHGGVVQYDLGKSQQTGFMRKGFLEAPPPELRQAVLGMQTEHFFEESKMGEYLSALLKPDGRFDRYTRPPAETDILFEAGYQHASMGKPCHVCGCDRTRIVQRQARGNRSDNGGGGSRVHYGLIASGDVVVKDGARRDQIAEQVGGDVLCFEMEAAGMLTEFPCLVIRGVSDYADAHKNDRWHDYAAAAAAACAKELLTFVEVGRDRRGGTPPRLASRPAASAPSTHSVFTGNGIHNVGGNITVGGSVNIGETYR